MTKAIVLIAAALSFSACSILEPRADPTRFFVLTAIEDSTSPAPAPSTDANAADASKTSIGLGPVSLPAYLERPEIVRRSSEHELVPSRVDRWGEPLDQAVLRVLAQDLAQVTGRRVLTYPWKTANAPAWTVEVDVARFEAVGEKQVELVADVDARRAADNTSLRRHEKIEVALAATDGDAVAKAMSEAAAQLARNLAAALAEKH